MIAVTTSVAKAIIAYIVVSFKVLINDAVTSVVLLTYPAHIMPNTGFLSIK